MWLCTSLGFDSIVQKDADTHHIRARSRADLEALIVALERSACTPARPHLHAVASYPGSDYPWRILCPSSALPQVFRVLAESIDYGKLTRSRLTFGSPYGPHALRDAVCLGARHAPRLKSAIAASPAQRDKLSAYHTIHDRMLDWQENELCSSET